MQIYGVFPYVAMFRLTSEASTLFVNIRWFLLEFNMKNSIYYTINGVIILITFTVFRIATLPSSWMSLYKLTLLPAWNEVLLIFKCICVFSCIPLDILNINWFFKIITMVVKTLKSKDKNKQTNKVD